MYKQDPRFSIPSEEVKKSGPLPSNTKAESTLDLAKEPKQTVVPSNKAVADLSMALKEEMLVCTLLFVHFI